MPKLSIIVPCYNQAKWLPEALASVLAQRFDAWECIIVNDGATDNTAEVAGQWCENDSRFKYISRANGGLPAARNTGIASAEGDFVLPLDADDKISKDYAQLAIGAFASNPALKLVYGKAAFFGKSEGPWSLPDYSWPQLLLQNCIYCSAVFRKADWVAAGGYDETMVNGLEDLDFWLRMLSPDSQVLRLEETVFYYRQHQQSMLSHLHNDSNLGSEVYNYLYKKHMEKYVEAFGHPLELIRAKRQLEAEKESWQRSFRYSFGRSIMAFLKGKQ